MEKVTKYVVGYSYFHEATSKEYDTLKEAIEGYKSEVIFDYPGVRGYSDVSLIKQTWGNEDDYYSEEQINDLGETIYEEEELYSSNIISIYENEDTDRWAVDMGDGYYEEFDSEKEAEEAAEEIAMANY